MLRLAAPAPTCTETDVSDQDDFDLELEHSLDPPSMTLQQQMELAIRASLSGRTLQRNVCDADCKGLEKSQLASVRCEMASFESSDVKSRGLQLVYEYLLTIPPASVEAVRSFSAAGLLCTNESVTNRWITCALFVLITKMKTKR